MEVSIGSARGFPEPTTVVAIDDRRQGQRIDRMFEPLRRLACSIHGKQARPAHMHPTKGGLPCARAGLCSSEGSQFRPSGNLNGKPIWD